MRKLIVGLILLLFPLSLYAQSQPKLEITRVRIGFPPSAQSATDGPFSYFKVGAWAPVFVDITAGKDGWKGGDTKLQLAIETPDNNETTTVYSMPVPLPVLQPGQSVTVLTYTKPGGTHSSITAILRAGTTTLGPQVRQNYPGLDMSQALYLLVGSDLPELRRVLDGAKLPDLPDDEPMNPGMQVSNERTPEFVGVADSVDELPDLWFGYQALDLIVLTTGRREFLDQLSADAKRREALAQWVLRGGHLLISVGKNQDAVAGLAEIESLLPVRLGGVAQRPGVDLGALTPKGGTLKGPIEVARLEPKPGRSLHPLIGPTVGDPEQPLLVAQAAVGLGRVTVVGFDLDTAPFASWPGRGEFLLALVGQAWPRGQLLGSNPNPNYNPGGDLLTDLFNDMERFEEVPVISFGWVALFIFIYILIVGPLDYWFLKKVVKRLELTWITFPTVVILISVIAYFAAYQIKGKDLRIRKLDLVDIDLRSQQAYGHTWLTLFSPRIENYTIGLQPVAGAKQEPGNSSVVMSWLGRPVYNQGFGFGSNRGQSLFRRAYDYAPSATGLERVPILVWTTKSFTADWSQSLAAEPMVSADLRAPDNINHVVGDITWRPGQKDAAFSPKDGFLIFRGRVYPLTLKAGEAAKVDIEGQVGGQAISDWSVGGLGSESFMYAALFFREAQAGRQGRRNHGLRELDQSWRLGADPEEAVLIVRLPAQQGPANEVNQNPTAPTRLWLGALPAGGGPNPELAGVMRQETYVRVFIPVQAGKK